jgi:microcystin-dependent protein
MAANQDKETPSRSPQQPMRRAHPQVQAAFVAALASLVVAFVTAWTTLRAKTTDTDAKIRELDAIAAEMLHQGKFPFIPSGTIQAYGGEPNTDQLEKRGWLLCDGRPYPTNKFPELFRAVGFAWGRGSAANEFRVPDLQGYFLRGVDSEGKRDLDVGDRQAIAPGGNAKNSVGSVQGEKIGPHRHMIRGNGGNSGGSAQLISATIGPSGGVPENGATENYSYSATGIGGHDKSIGTETRPKNAYVHYIIKY